MNNKWTYLLIALLSIAAAAGVDARPDREQRGKAMMDALGLSDEQRVHIEKLREEHREEMQALRMSGVRPDPEAMERLFDVHQRQIAETLTPEQREQIEEWLQIEPTEEELADGSAMEKAVTLVAARDELTAKIEQLEAVASAHASLGTRPRKRSSLVAAAI